jgi:hypothetical protein
MTTLEDAIQAIETAQKQAFIAPAHTQAITGFRDALQAASRGEPPDADALEAGLNALHACIMMPGSPLPSAWQITTYPNFDGGPGGAPGGEIYHVYPTAGQGGDLSVMVDATGAPYLATLSAPGPEGAPDTFVFDLRQQHGQWRLRVDGSDGPREIPVPPTAGQLGWTATPRGTMQEDAMAGAIALAGAGAGLLGAAAGAVASAAAAVAVDALSGARAPQTEIPEGATVVMHEADAAEVWYLTITQGVQAGERYAITTATILGRSEEATIRLNDDRISRRHAQLNVTEEGGCWIADLQSSNGTLVNDQHITTSTWLNPGDVITLGTTVLKLTKESQR